jgi:hypothetical protein
VSKKHFGISACLTRHKYVGQAARQADLPADIVQKTPIYICAI